jgi:hypothetical protein
LADETGIEFYTVEKSSDEQNWNFLQSLSSGKSQGTASYTFFDPHPFQGVSYYRVRIVYSSGRVELTQPAKVETYESSIMAFSALGSHQLSVLIDSRLDHSETMISMYNSQGIKLLEKQVRIQKGMNKIFIPLGSIPRGHYVASIITNNRAFNQSIILQ